jgi:hypothetical protein
MLGSDGISSERQKLLRTIREFGNYIAVNQAFIPDYGDRHRNCERISTAFAESAVNQLVSRRMVKQQQMHWTERGAHLLLQVRAQVLNGDLRKVFGRRYPGMQARSEEPVRLVARSPFVGHGERPEKVRSAPDILEIPSHDTRPATDTPASYPCPHRNRQSAGRWRGTPPGSRRTRRSCRDRSACPDFRS